MIPTAPGRDHRIVSGRVHITANTVTDPQEIDRRLKLFQERAGYYYENRNTFNGQWEKRISGLIAELDGIR